ncbi:MAG: O-antigen ligase family protein [Bacteroidia bacterium]|nr:O-antigen ligase family protein [Bacteroidia bacterium]
MRFKDVKDIKAIPVGAWYVGAALTMAAWQYAAYRWNFRFFPVFGAAALVLALTLTDVRRLWLLTVFLVPFSVNLEAYLEGAAISLPTDLLALTLCGFVLLKPGLRSGAWKTPVGFAVFIYMAWLGLCVFFSSRPVVSLKFCLSYAWHLVAFWFLSTYFFKQDRKNVAWALGLLTTAACVVAFYTLVRHSGSGFSLGQSYGVMQPFYKEHTAYAASLAAVWGYTVVFAVRNRSFAYAAATTLLTVAIVFSYTRGAWLGMAAWLTLWFGLWLWIRRPRALVGLAAALVVGALAASRLSTDKSEKDDRRKSLADRVVSTFNTGTDVSNRERFNRWVAALNMAAERPWFGFGPGTYAMEYAPYQEARFRTKISTNQGDVGSAHNEWLLALSESGVMGAILLTMLFFVPYAAAFRAVLQDRERTLHLAALGAMTTFYAHALVNNFLDQDKVNGPIFLAWALTAAFWRKR